MVASKLYTAQVFFGFLIRCWVFTRNTVENKDRDDVEKAIRELPKMASQQEAQLLMSCFEGQIRICW